MVIREANEKCIKEVEQMKLPQLDVFNASKQLHVFNKRIMGHNTEQNS